MRTIQEIRNLLATARANQDNLTPFNAGVTVSSIVATLDALIDELDEFGSSPEAQALAKVMQVPAGTALLPATPLTPNPNSPAPTAGADSSTPPWF